MNSIWHKIYHLADTNKMAFQFSFKVPVGEDTDLGWKY